MKLGYFFLLLICSCSLFKGQKNLKIEDTEKLIDSVQLVGEGKGRLTFGRNQYLFSVDSVLNDQQDWILAVTIPLQGEEVMILKDLKKPEVENEETESFEKRIESEFARLKLKKKITAQTFIKEMRSLVRFHLSSKWNEARVCKAQQTDAICELGKEKFLVVVKKNELQVEKISEGSAGLKLIAKNLTGPIFTQTMITLSSEKEDLKQGSSNLALELFW